MRVHYKYKAAAWFVGGALCGTVILACLLKFAGWPPGLLPAQPEAELRLAELQRLNSQLTDRLFALQGDAADPVERVRQPFEEGADARAAVAVARDRAVQQRKFLMVTFGANWCMDCRTLYRNLESEEVAAYTRNLFHFANVDVGKYNRNRDLAEELGVDLSRGIPVAIFFNPDGQVIGTTNGGELEPARRYSSKQILRFMRDIAERSQIAAPDSVGG